MKIIHIIQTYMTPIFLFIIGVLVIIYGSLLTYPSLLISILTGGSFFFNSVVLYNNIKSFENLNLKIDSLNSNIDSMIVDFNSQTVSKEQEKNMEQSKNKKIIYNVESKIEDNDIDLFEPKIEKKKSMKPFHPEYVSGDYVIKGGSISKGQPKSQQERKQKQLEKDWKT